MIFTSPGEVALTVCGFDIYYYGIFLAIAICVSIFCANYVADRYYHYNNIILDVSPYILSFGVIGARLYYCILNYNYYFTTPIEFFAIRNGGLSIHGAIFAGALTLLYYCKKNHLNFSKLCDILAIALPLGQAIGRWGNFFNSEAFGIPTTLPWKLYISPEHRPLEYFNSSYFHPTFLYESLLDLFIFFIMIIILKKNNKFKSGVLACIYLILYSLARIFVEYFRIDSNFRILNIAFPIWISLLIILFASIILFKKIK